MTVILVEDWRLHAACLRKVRPHVFLPDDTGDRHKTEAAHQAALAICRGCTVTTECLEYALAAGETWGIWGGTTPRQRRSIRESRQGVGSQHEHVLRRSD